MTLANEPKDPQHDIDAITVSSNYAAGIKALREKAQEFNDVLKTQFETKLDTATKLLSAGNLSGCFDKITETVRMINRAQECPEDNLLEEFQTSPSERPSVPTYLGNSEYPLHAIRADMERRVGHLRAEREPEKDVSKFEN